MIKPKILDRAGLRFARFAVKGCLTRMALVFKPEETYTGAEVQQLLIGAALSIDRAIANDAKRSGLESGPSSRPIT